jgi:hypothetical protein
MKIMRNKVKQPLDRRFVSSPEGKATEPPMDGEGALSQYASHCLFADSLLKLSNRSPSSLCVHRIIFQVQWIDNAKKKPRFFSTMDVE